MPWAFGTCLSIRSSSFKFKAAVVKFYKSWQLVVHRPDVNQDVYFAPIYFTLLHYLCSSVVICMCTHCHQVWFFIKLIVLWLIVVKTRAGGRSPKEPSHLKINFHSCNFETVLQWISLVSLYSRWAFFSCEISFCEFLWTSKTEPLKFENLHSL